MVLLIIPDCLVVLSQEVSMEGIKNTCKVLFYKNACILVIKRVAELELFRLEKMRLRGDPLAAFLYIKGLIRRMERDFLPRPVVTRQGARVLN